jgi:GntR family transcriptional regulator/MocR family aminotransferase
MVKQAGGALLQNITLERATGRSIGAQIATGLRLLIVKGDLKTGERLPATRTLAGELSVARSTVVEAFEQLISEGLIETRVGAGSFVSAAFDGERPQGRSVAPRPAQPERLAKLMDMAMRQVAKRITHEPRAFTTAMPAFDAFPMAIWSRLLAKHWRRDRVSVLGYGDPLGFRPLREAIAQHLSVNRGIAGDWRQIFICAGAQQAFQLIAGTLIDPLDKVWFEDPGAIGARNSFVAHGASVIPVGVDEHGLKVEDGLVKAPDFRLAFVTPTHQQPLGAKMSYDRRLALLAAANAAQAWIIEDDWDGEFCFAGRPQPALKSIDSGDRVIYVGTFSKSLFPSLRLGFLLAPAALVPTFELALGAFLPGVATALQAAVAEFMAEGHFATHIRRMRKLYGERHDALIDWAGRSLSPWLHVEPTTIGLHTAAFLKPGLVAADISERCAARGVTVAPISRFCFEPYPREGFVLGFSGIPPAKIRQGVESLADVLKNM